MPAILDHQHRGKPNRPNDQGAAVDLDGDGTIEASETEVYLVEGYLSSCSEDLAVAGELCAWLASGHYSERHQRARVLAEHWRDFLAPVARAAYIASHLNAAGDPSADYGAVFFDHRSRGGEELAHEIAGELAVLLPTVRVIAATPNDWTKNAYSTIRGVYRGPSYLSAVCFEPVFLTSPETRDMLTPEGLRQIGQALAAGILRWTRKGIE